MINLYKIILLILLPFLGTTLGACFIFFIKKNMKIKNILLSFSAGIMLSASIWSLIIPSLENDFFNKKITCFITSISILVGVFFLIFSDKIIYKNNKNKNVNMLNYAIILHNIPEGMAVGVAISKYLITKSISDLALAVTLTLGISIQNIPEGMAISLPYKSIGYSNIKSFLKGMLSGIVEPIFTIITIIFSSFFGFLLPFCLAFAGGAMIYVVLVELIPECQKEKSVKEILSFFIGFLIMMVLDVIL